MSLTISKQKLKTTRLILSPDRKTSGILYIRYADDWILFTRGNESLAHAFMPLELKEICEKWILENLKLKLSQEKTKNTNLNKEKAHFLGYEIFKIGT
jgi:hypothetical protein